MCKVDLYSRSESIGLKGVPDQFWGKLGKEGLDEDSLWHPLIDHMADVAACCEALLDGTILNTRLARLAGLRELSPSIVSRLCVFAALHDIGKFNNGFQNRAFPGSRPEAGHIREVVALLLRGDGWRDKLVAALGRGLLKGWGEDASFRFLLAALSHHGRLVNFVDPGVQFNPALWKASPRGLDPLRGISDVTLAALRWFPKALEPAPSLPDSPQLQHAFAGLVMLADWVGSDTTLFPYSRNGDPDRIDFARQQARLALQQLGLDTTVARRVMGVPSFSTISEHAAPRSAQRAIDMLPPALKGSITVLEAETGSGKTEAALLHFVKLLHAGEVDGLYFALPTRTAATQIHHRVHEAIRRAFPNPESRPPVLLAVPGYLQVDDRTGTRLPHFQVLWNDRDRERWRFRGWAAEHPKRYLAGAVVVGTIDQVLLSVLKVNHGHLRALGLLRHLLVVDEVHASDSYMTRLLQEVLRHHTQAGGHALLMSATLGSAARYQLMWPAKKLKPPPLEEMCLVDYPMLSHRLLPELAAPVQKLGIGNGKATTASLSTWADAPETIAAEALKAAATGARVLIIRNTVTDCLATQRALECQVARDGLSEALLMRCNGLSVPHHSRYARADRQQLDEQIEQDFGKTSRTGRVVVATQTVQQSLDLDADWMITDLCPMDVLLQRIGRLHRHLRKDHESQRPERFRCPEVIVMVPEDGQLDAWLLRSDKPRGRHGLGSVYDNLCILQATWDLLKERKALVVPEDSRELVERTTHPDALAVIAADRGPHWQKHARRIFGAAIAEKMIARGSCTPWDEPVGEMKATFGKEDGRATTRLGEQDRLIRFDPPLDSPFGSRVRQLTLPHHFVPKSDADELIPEDVEQTPDGFTFRLLNQPYRYSRLGYEKE